MTEEERIAALEEKQRQAEASSHVLLGIVKGIDAKATLTETRLNVISAYQAAHDVRLNAITQDMQTSFRQIEAAMVTKEDFEEGIQSLRNDLLTEMGLMEKRILDALKKNG